MVLRVLMMIAFPGTAAWAAGQAGCGDISGLGALVDTTRQLTQLIVAGCVLYFVVGLVVNLAQAQLATATGDAGGYARALQQAISLAILLAVAVALPGLGAALQSWLTCTDGTAGSVLALWKALAQLVVAIVVSGAGIASTVAIVWSGLGLQAAHTVGIARGVAGGIWRMAVLVGGLVLTLTAVLLANYLLGLFW